MRSLKKRQPIETRRSPKNEKIYEGPTVLTTEAISVQAHVVSCGFGRDEKELIFKNFTLTVGPKYILTNTNVIG